MDYVLECTRLMNSPKGVLHLINNYQGDRMCWDMAREAAEAEGIKIATVIVDDDVSVENSTYTTGRRGVAGNFFVIKACGAAAEQGKSLEQVAEIGKKVNGVVRSMGVALTGCTPPAKGKPIFELADDEVELGVGIHGEPGRRREKLRPADEILDEVFEAVSSDLPFKSGDKVGLMINGLGGTPLSELYVLYRRAAQNCEKKRHQDRAQLRRQLLHRARDGRHVADHDSPRRRDRETARRAGRDRPAHLLSCLTHGEVSAVARATCCPGGGAKRSHRKRGPTVVRSLPARFARPGNK